MSAITTAVVQWKHDLETQWTTGDLKDTTRVFVDVDVLHAVFIRKPMPAVLSTEHIDVDMLVSKEEKSPPPERVALLLTLFVPESARRKGVASAVIEYIESRVNRELGYRLAIGPIFDETGALQRIATNRGYSAVHPFTFLQSKLPTAHDTAHATSAGTAAATLISLSSTRNDPTATNDTRIVASTVSDVTFPSTATTTNTTAATSASVAHGHVSTLIAKFNVQT